MANQDVHRHTVATVGKIFGAENWQISQLRRSLMEANPSRSIGKKVGNKILYSDADIGVFQANANRITPRYQPEIGQAPSITIIVIGNDAGSTIESQVRDALKGVIAA